jgi:hypothetical protein
MEPNEVMLESVSIFAKIYSSRSSNLYASKCILEEVSHSLKSAHRIIFGP